MSNFNERFLPRARFTRRVSLKPILHEEIPDLCVICQHTVPLCEGVCETTKAGVSVRICNACMA